MCLGETNESEAKSGWDKGPPAVRVRGSLVKASLRDGQGMSA